MRQRTVLYRTDAAVYYSNAAAPIYYAGLLPGLFDTAIEGTRLVLTRAIEKREHSQKEATEAYNKLSQQLDVLEAAIKGFNSL